MATNIFTLPIGVPVVTRPSSAVMNVWVAPGAAGGVLIETFCPMASTTPLHRKACRLPRIA